MSTFLRKNTKITKSNNEFYNVFNYGIPAYKAADGTITCKMAGTCGKDGGCYAQQGRYLFSNVKNAYEWRYEQSLRYDFADLIGKEIRVKVKTAKRQGKQVVIRVHDSGDFYSMRYTEKWFQIAQLNPEVIFYAYTKMIPLFNLLKKQNKIPSNFRIIYSEGGLADKLIKADDFHARVFESKAELDDAGYADASKDDLIAGLGTNNKIGLVYHGYKSKKWVTNK